MLKDLKNFNFRKSFPGHVLCLIMSATIFNGCGTETHFTRTNDGQLVEVETNAGSDKEFTAVSYIGDYECPADPEFARSALGCNDQRLGSVFYIPKVLPQLNINDAKKHCESLGMTIPAAGELTWTIPQLQKIYQGRSLQFWTSQYGTYYRLFSFVSGSASPSYTTITDTSVKNGTVCTAPGFRVAYLPNQSLTEVFPGRNANSVITGKIQVVGGKALLMPDVNIPHHTQYPIPDLQFFWRRSTYAGEHSKFVAVVNADGKSVYSLEISMALKSLPGAMIRDLEGRPATIESLDGMRVRIKGSAGYLMFDRTTLRIDYSAVEFSELSAVPTPQLGGCVMEGPLARTTALGCEITHPINSKKLTLATYNKNIGTFESPDILGSNYEYFNSGFPQVKAFGHLWGNRIVGATSFAVPAGQMVVGAPTSTLMSNGGIVASSARKLSFEQASMLSRTCGFNGSHFPNLKPQQILEFGNYYDFARGVRRDGKFGPNVGNLATIVNGNVVFVDTVTADAQYSPYVMCEALPQVGRVVIPGSFVNHRSAKVGEFNFIGSSGLQGTNYLTAAYDNRMSIETQQALQSKHNILAEFKSDELRDSKQVGELAFHPVNHKLDSIFVEDSAGVRRRMLGFFARRSVNAVGAENMYFAGPAFKILDRCKKISDCQQYKTLTHIDSRYNQQLPDLDKGWQSGFVIMKRRNGVWQVLAERWLPEGPLDAKRPYAAFLNSSFEVSGQGRVTLQFVAKTYSNKTFTLYAIDQSDALSSGGTGIYGEGIKAQEGHGFGHSHVSFANYAVSVPSSSVRTTPCQLYTKNPKNPYDVNGDGVVTRFGDAMSVMYELYLISTGKKAEPSKYSACPQPLMMDVNGDGKLTNEDLQMIISAT